MGSVQSILSNNWNVAREDENFNLYAHVQMALEIEGLPVFYKQVSCFAGLTIGSALDLMQSSRCLANISLLNAT